MSARVMAVANQKGGTGKSTMAVNLALAAALETSSRVLVIDVDPQADATTMFGVEPAEVGRTLYDVLVGACELPDAIARDVAPGVDLVVGSEKMSDVEVTLAGQMMREQYLREALEGHIDGYDLVLIDCPPNLGLLTVNAFVAAPEVLVVVSMTDRNAYKGLMSLVSTVGELRRKRVDVQVTAAVRNNVDPRRVTYRLLDQALGECGVPICATQIPMRTDFHNAATQAIPMLQFDPDDAGSIALRELARELLADAASLGKAA